MTSEGITIARAELTAEVSRGLIASLNAELNVLYPEPGANHFQLDPEEVAYGRGAFLVVYRGERRSAAAPCGSSIPKRPNSSGCMYLPSCVGKASAGVSWLHSKRRRWHLVFGDSSSKPESGRPPPWRSIEQPASNESPFSGSTASPRRRACVSARTSQIMHPDSSAQVLRPPNPALQLAGCSVAALPLTPAAERHYRYADTESGGAELPTTLRQRWTPSARRSV